MKPDDALHQVLGPVGRDEFLQSYFERQPLHVSGRNAGHFQPLVSLARIERLLSTAALSFPGTQLTRSGQPVPVEEYTDDESRIVPKRLAQHHADGATVVISQAHRLLGSLNDLCRALQSQLKLRCQTNVYLTPPGHQGFNPHYDAHDVFILQVEGRKTFRFYEGGPALPMSHQGFDASAGECGPQTEEIDLQGGDTLYIPRGVMHDAVADGTDASLHVTLGVYSITVHEVLQEMLRDAAEHDVDLRRSAATQAWEGVDAGPGQAVGSLMHLFDRICTEERLITALSRLEDDIAIDGAPDCEGLLRDPRQRAELTLESRVQLRACAILNTERRAGLLKVRLPGQVLEFREPVSLAVDALLSGPCQRIAELPGLTDEQRLDLCQRLLHEQVIELTAMSAL